MMMRTLSLLLLLGLVASSVQGEAITRLPPGIKVRLTGGPSTKPQSRCFAFEAVEAGDLVVINFSAYIADESPSGTPGTLITSHKDHNSASASSSSSSMDEWPIAVPVGSAEIHASWDLALIGLCEHDQASILVPPKYTHGKVFEGADLPKDAIVRVDVEIVDILEEDYDSSDSDSYSDDEEDSNDEEEMDTAAEAM